MIKAKLEHRYLVIKLSDAAEYLTPFQQTQLEHLIERIKKGRVKAGKKSFTKYICIAEDWPMYEEVVKKLLDWVDSLNPLSKVRSRFGDSDIDGSDIEG